jgi:H+-transporting ATPase
MRPACNPICTATYLTGVRWRIDWVWRNRPSLWLAVSSVADVLIASVLAIGGIAMTPVPATVVGGTLAAAAVFAFALDAVKVPVFARLKIV